MKIRKTQTGWFEADTSSLSQAARLEGLEVLREKLRGDDRLRAKLRIGEASAESQENLESRSIPAY